MTEPTDACQSIIRTMHRYCRALDYGLADEWLAVFTPDATYDTILPDGSYYVRLGNPDEFCAFLESYPRPPATYQKHVTLNPIIEVDGDDATAESAFVFLTRAADAKTPQVTAFGRYLDRFRNVDGVWRIAQRVCETEAMIPA
jgi:3-phenylpropionate/cinnamic acid dioxygenase small subunit